MVDLIESFADVLQQQNGRDFLWMRYLQEPQSGLDWESHQMQALASSARSDEQLYLWQNDSCLVVPKSYQTKTGFSDAVASCPIPVAVRRSGGMAVIHGSHTANLTLMIRQNARLAVNIVDIFNALGAKLFPALTLLGVVARFEQVSGAYCGGRYDIASRGRKLAGTAAMVRRFGEQRIILAHAAINLHHCEDDLPIIAAFESALGFKADYRSDKITSIWEEWQARTTECTVLGNLLKVASVTPAHLAPSHHFTEMPAYDQ